MRLINDFFKVIESSVSATGSVTTIELNPGHLVYTGHFPGYPVTPGVIQIQIVHELFEHQFGKKVKLKTISQCKFLKVLNPNETSRVVVHIEFSGADGLLHIKAWSENATDIFFKMKSIYQFNGFGLPGS